MLSLPHGFLHGEILQARKGRGLILAKARYAGGLCVWLVIGLLVYFTYGSRHSRVRGDLLLTPSAEL